jgi:3-oxoadipate enol-lactonase/4-carboxymuconolactone decarboxylase
MPFLNVDGARLYYRLEGQDGLPVLVLSHSLGVDHGQWDPQVPDLLPHFQVLRYDIRGHGASDVTAGDYTIERLARDVLAMADALQIKQFAICGVSLGGMIGQWLAAFLPERVTHAVLANTSPRMPDPSFMEARRATVLELGMAAIADTAMQRFFSPELLSKNPPRVATCRRTLLATDPAGYAACCAAIRDMDNTHLLSKIRVPVLIVDGDRDVSTPWTGNGEVLASFIAGAKTVHLRAAHLSNLDSPRSFSTALLEFLLPAAAADTLPAGFAMRRAVLGDAYVNAAISRTTDFNREFQEMITRYAWGTIWTRPGLDVRTRRLLVLAVTAALGRWDEFRLHVRTSGLEACDLKEVLLQTAIYAGVPAANTGFQIAAEELERRSP